jgi:hypothetical protein
MLLLRYAFRFIIVGGFCLIGFAHAAEGRWEDPWAAQPAAKAVPAHRSVGTKAADALFHVWSHYISPVDGDRCPAYPTCAQYARDAIRKHGLLIGTVMAFDRLIHDADEAHRAPMVKIYDTYRAYDPVENNDFWWYKK